MCYKNRIYDRTKIMVLNGKAAISITSILFKEEFNSEYRKLKEVFHICVIAQFYRQPDKNNPDDNIQITQMLRCHPFTQSVGKKADHGKTGKYHGQGSPKVPNHIREIEEITCLDLCCDGHPHEEINRIKCIKQEAC